MFEIRLPTFHSNGFLRLNNFNLYNMREILFKAKRVDGKGWVEGDYFYNFNDSMHVISQVIHDTGNFDEPPFDYQKLINVKLGTVCQFTGLVDRNGVKIFEGDIVHSNGYLWSIVFENGAFYAYHHTILDNKKWGGIWRFEECEIFISLFGSIHD